LTQKELIEKLKSLGFKEYEAKVLIVLLKGKPMSASEIAKEAKLIRNSIYDTLKSFAEKGYCNEIETNTVLKYQIIEPRIIADKIRHDYRESLRVKIDAVEDTFTEIDSIFKDKKSDLSETESIELIRGFNKHRVAKYMELIQQAKFEILSMNKIRGLVSEEINEFTQNFTKNGGKIRSIYRAGLDFKVLKNGVPTPAANEDLIRVCKMFESFGEEIKLSDINIPNLIIVDREKVFLNIAGKKSRTDQTDLIIYNPAIANNMLDLFNYYWEQSNTIEEYKNGK
jgi:sugar-specific transcriptional regulator TrmB